MTQLDIKLIIDFLIEKENIIINRKDLLVDKYESLKIDNNKNIDNLLKCIIIANNLKEDIDSIKNNIQNFINDLPIDSNKKKKYINSINSINNDNIIILSLYFSINIIIYNNITQVSKLYYYDKYLDIEYKFIIIKDTDTYEIIKENKRNLFNFDDKIIKELLNNIFVVENKELKYKEIKIKTIPKKILILIDKLKLLF